MGLVGPCPEDPSYVALYLTSSRRSSVCDQGSQVYRTNSVPRRVGHTVGDDYDELYRNALLPREITLDRYYARRRCLAL